MTFRNCQIEIDDNVQIIGGRLGRVFKNGKGKSFFFPPFFLAMIYILVLIAYTSLCIQGFNNLITSDILL